MRNNKYHNITYIFKITQTAEGNHEDEELKKFMSIELQNFNRIIHSGS